MKSRENFLSYIDEAREAAGLAQVPDAGLDAVEKNIKEAELVIPVVGGFSAGKSSLINSFLGKDILPVAITPETALAAELHHADDSYIEAVAPDGAVSVHSISDFVALKEKAGKLRNLRVYLEDESLKKIWPLVLVDMPGFDSPFEAHNQAILNYLNRGSYFVFLSSVEDGCLTRSMRSQIQDIHGVGKGFSFCLSKVNLRSAGEVEKVRANVAEQLEDYFDYKEGVVLLDNNGGSSLNAILQAIDPDALFASLFSEILKENYFSLMQSIDLRSAALNGSKQQAEDAVAALKDAIERIERKKEAALKDIEKNYSMHHVSAIVEGVSRDLLEQKNGLVELAIKNKDAFSREINEIARSALLREVRKAFKEVGDKIILDFSSSMRLEFSREGLLNEGMLERIESVSRVGLEQAISAMGSFSERMKGKSEGPDGKDIYRVVATIVGLTTAVVSPVLEALIIFLPDIIRFFAGDSQEREIRNQVEAKILVEVIPGVKAKVREALPQILSMQISSLINQVGEQFESQLQQKRDEIAAAEMERNRSVESVNESMLALAQAKKKLSEAASRYLHV